VRNNEKPVLHLLRGGAPEAEKAPSEARFLFEDLAIGSILRRLPLRTKPELWRVTGFSEQPYLRKGRYLSRSSRWASYVRLVRIGDGFAQMLSIAYIAYSAMWQLVDVPPTEGADHAE
jgi:hypothetical protein